MKGPCVHDEAYTVSTGVAIGLAGALGSAELCCGFYGWYGGMDGLFEVCLVSCISHGIVVEDTFGFVQDGDCPVSVFLEWYEDGDMIFGGFPWLSGMALAPDGLPTFEISVVHLSGVVGGDVADFILSGADGVDYAEEIYDCFLIEVLSSAYGGVEASEAL